MCQEHSLTDFVGDLGDLKVLLTSMSPAVHELLKSTFSQTKYTKRIENLDCRNDEDFRVFGSQSPVISKDKCALNEDRNFSNR